MANYTKTRAVYLSMYGRRIANTANNKLMSVALLHSDKYVVYLPTSEKSRDYKKLDT